MQRSEKLLNSDQSCTEMYFVGLDEIVGIQMIIMVLYLITMHSLCDREL